MASTDNRTEMNDADSVTNWTGQGKEAVNTDAGQFYEGTGSIEDQHSDADEETANTAITGNPVDLSDATCYMLVKDNLCESYANGGMQYVLGDGTDLIGYDVGGNDAPGLSLPTFWNCWKLDVSVIVATPGSFAVYSGSEANLDQTAISAAGFGTLHLAKAVGAIPNVFIDRISYMANDSYALTVSGGTVGTHETTGDLALDDVSGGWGMVSNPVASQFQFFAPTEWGNAVATENTYYDAIDEQWFWIGDNGGVGGHIVGATHFPMRIVGNATDTTDITWSNLVIVNTGQRAQFLAGDTNCAVRFTNVSFTDVGEITFSTNDANRFANGCSFSNCDQVTFGSLDADDCTFNGTTDALGAVLWSTTPADVANQTGFTFNSDGTGHAIEISLNTASLTTYSITDYEVTGYETTSDGTTGNTVFLVDNALDGDVTINVTNGTGTFSYERAAGYTGTVTIVQSVTLELTGIETDSEVRIINLDDVTNFNKELTGIEQVLGGVTKATIAAGGTGYTNGAQVLTVVGGTGTAATINVTVAGGVVTSVDSIASSGSYSVNPTNPVTTSGGGGTGCTLRLTIGGTFTYNYDASSLPNVAIIVFHLDFTEVRIEQSLSATSQTIPIQQRGDRVFNNP